MIKEINFQKLCAQWHYGKAAHHNWNEDLLIDTLHQEFSTMTKWPTSYKTETEANYFVDSEHVHIHVNTDWHSISLQNQRTTAFIP